MRSFSLEVFGRTPEEWDLRLFGPDTKLIETRTLPRSAIEDLIGAADQAPFGEKLGQVLYDWLDGPERWMRRMRQDGPSLALAIDVEERLRHLPWELLADGGSFLCASRLWTFTPVCRTGRAGGTATACNRPLRMLSMACSPEDTGVLDLENEERLVLKATRSQRIELLVEESGSLQGLEEAVASFPRDYFDVFHLAGHAEVVAGLPTFLMEDELGRGREATAADIAHAFAGRWPRLLFLSGCETGQAVDLGARPSLCEALVLAGAPAVLGWTQPVDDAAASEAASVLYGRLAAGDGIDEAVACARHALNEKGRPDWHLLRLYADRTPLSPLVTPLRTPGRAPFRSRSAGQELHDRGGRTEVCSREEFVGRRRLLQRSLAVLKGPPEEPRSADGLLLHGLGGLGKSSAAARLCERLPHLSRLVWAGRIDEESLLAGLRGRIEDAAELERLDDRRLPLETRLRRLLEGPLAAEPALFVFDDFEPNLDIRADGRAVLQPAALAALRSVLGAIRESAFGSRVLVTCRYRFEVPPPERLHVEALESLRGADRDKKLLRMAERQDGGGWLGFKGVSLAAGNPRLLERMQAAAADEPLEPIAAAFREELRLAEWVARQEPEGRRLLALLSAFDWPVQRPVLEEVAAGLALDPHLDRAAAAGLVEAIEDPLLGPRYSVSALLQPLLEPELADPGRAEEWQRTAQRAVEYFQANLRSVVAESQDVNLPVAACRLLAASRSDDAAARLLAHEVTPYLMALGAYRRLIDVHSRITRSLRTPQLVAMSAIDVANARLALGEREAAAESLLSAVALAAETGDPQREASALTDLGSCYLEMCDFDRAVPRFEQAAFLARREGWDNLEILATLGRASCHELTGDCARALELLEGVLRQARAKHLEIEEICCLASVGNCRAALGDEETAVALFEEALAQLDGREPLSWGTTLHSLAESLADRGKIAEAIAAAEKVAAIGEQVANPRLLVEGQTALTRAFLLAGQLPQARTAVQKAVRHDVPLYRPPAYFLLGLMHLLVGNGAPAAEAFTRALAAAEELLGRNRKNLIAVEARALAAAGLALCPGTPAAGAWEALRDARAAHSRSALSGREKRLDALLTLLPGYAAGLPGALPLGRRPAVELTA